MYKLALLFGVFIALNATAKNNSNSNYLNNNINSAKNKLETMLFTNVEDSYYTDLDIKEIKVIELDEEVEIGFDIKKYLPKNFNALKGKYDLDWSSIELVEIEEEADLGFDTKAYLPADFDPYKELMEDNASICLY